MCHQHRYTTFIIDNMKLSAIHANIINKDYLYLDIKLNYQFFVEIVEYIQK